MLHNPLALSMTYNIQLNKQLLKIAFSLYITTRIIYIKRADSARFISNKSIWRYTFNNNFVKCALNAISSLSNNTIGFKRFLLFSH
jgi:hypothetical protein